jgi:hypothetical protein
LKNLDDIDHRALFVLPVEDRKDLIEKGSEMFWRQCEMTSVLTGKGLFRILKQSLDILDFRIQELQEEEEYELCYFLKEVCWETHQRLEKEKKNV